MGETHMKGQGDHVLIGKAEELAPPLLCIIRLSVIVLQIKETGIFTLIKHIFVLTQKQLFYVFHLMGF